MSGEGRWVDGDASPEVRRLLDSAVIDEPTPAQLASLEAKMAATLAAPAAPAAVASGVAVKVVGSVVLLAVGIGAGVWIGKRSEVPPEPALVAPAVAVVPVEPAPVVVTGGVPAVPETMPNAPKVLPMKRPAAVPVVQPPKPEPVVDELALLQAAMAAPTAGESLKLVEQHMALFPQSDLAQEREVLAIKALVKLERFDDARARATQFKARWPTSPHALRVEALLKNSP